MRIIGLVLTLLASSLYCYADASGQAIYATVELDQAHADVARVFNLAYFDPRIYRIADCNSNVWRLLKRLDDQGIDLTQAHVFYILQTTNPDIELSEASLNKLHPLKARLGIASLTVPWVFHVNLEYDGVIFDLDFRHWPHPTAVDPYFRAMFSESERKSLYVRAIPATEYLREYDNSRESTKNWKYFLFDPEQRFLLARAPQGQDALR